MHAPMLTAEEVAAFSDEVFPQQAGVYRIASVAPMAAVVTQAVDERHLRPGGTVSGPTMFAIADYAFYIAVLAMIGREPLTVTTTLTINFLRKPPAAELRAEARILKLGRTLATGDVLLHSASVADPVAQAVVSYAVPPKRG